MPDLQLLTIHLENGVERESLPGLIALTPPRRAARGREDDVLVAFTCCLNGNNGKSSQSTNPWLQKAADKYYHTSGTVTFALKSMVEGLNNDLLERNLNQAKDGQRVTAALDLVVLRRESLFLFNIGTAKTWFCSETDSFEFFDSENQGRGLGVNQRLVCRFSTREVKENDLLILSCQPPEIWKTDTFNGCAVLSNEAVGRRLLNQISPNLNAVLVRFIQGKGSVTLAPLFNRQTILNPLDKDQTTQPAAAIQKGSKMDADGDAKKTFLHPFAPASDDLLATEAVVDSPRDVHQNDAEAVTINHPGSDASHSVDPSGEKDQKTNLKNPSEIQVKAGNLTRNIVENVQKSGSSFNRFLQKIVPGITDEPIKWSRSSLIGIALGVPLLIALIAGSVYVKVGKSREFNQNLVMAQQYAIQAEVVAHDEPMRLASLQQAIFWLDKAESYGESEESTSLRMNVQGALDEMQGIQRLEMVEAVPGGLKAGSDISQIVATSTDLYLLDDKSGTVKRYSMESTGYEPDESFDCGPNPDNPLNTLGKLVDFVPLNENNSFKATIFAIDGSGNIEYCIPGESGVTSSLTFPDQGWIDLKSITIVNSYLYVLDSGGNAVYRYEGDGIQFDTKPTLFFDNQIPSLTEAIDIEVNGDELYILRSNGQLVECTYSHMKDYKLTECIDPAPYGDMRTGQEPEPISFPESNFIQLHLTSAPDSSIYLLDTTAKALYHFSLQRNLQKVLHPRDLNGSDLDRLTPTAFAISSGRMAFMAFGNQIYYSTLP